MDAIPTGVYLKLYAGESEDFVRTPLNGHARLRRALCIFRQKRLFVWMRSYQLIA